VWWCYLSNAGVGEPGTVAAMGLFSRKPDPDKELAKAVAKRGVAGRATVVEMREGADGRHEFTLEIDGARCRVSQRMSPPTLHKVAPGEPLSVLYDPNDISQVVILGHADYRMTEHGMVRVEDIST
jgi:hypothetical protein